MRPSQCFFLASAAALCAGFSPSDGPSRDSGDRHLAVAGSMQPGASPYVPGFEWERVLDYDEGSVNFASDGNPNTDAAGNAVWQYEDAPVGQPLGDASPWYEQAGPLMIWDPSWFGTGYPLWVRANDGPASVERTTLTHVLTPSFYPSVPLVRWMNPMETAGRVFVSGSLRITWTGAGNVGAPVDVDLAVVHDDLSANEYVPLLVTTASKPTNDASPEDLTIDVESRFIEVEPGDEILITLRGAAAIANRWIYLVDSLSIVIVESEPCQAADLADPFGLLDLADISAFVAGFVAMDPIADLVSDGLFDLADITQFVGSFVGGCP